jgi:hypothetical protein
MRMMKMEKYQTPYIKSKCYVCKIQEPHPAVAMWNKKQEVWVCMSHLGSEETKTLSFNFPE